MPEFTHNDLVVILEVAYITMVVAAILKLLVAPVIERAAAIWIPATIWIPPTHTLPSRQSLFIRALMLSALTLFIFELQSFWQLISAVYNKNYEADIPVYATFSIIPGLMIVVFYARPIIEVLGLTLGLILEYTFDFIGRISIIATLRHAVFKSILFLFHTPLRRLSLLGVPLICIFWVLAVQYNVVPWALFTEIYYSSNVVSIPETLSRQDWLQITEVVVILLLFLLISTLVIAPVLSQFFFVLSSWGATPVRTLERWVIFLMLIACLIYGGTLWSLGRP